MALDLHSVSVAADTQSAECRRALCQNLLQVTVVLILHQVVVLLPISGPSSFHAYGPLPGRLAAQVSQLHNMQIQYYICAH